MDKQNSIFQSLQSDELFVQGMHASDVRSLWRTFARTKEARDVARFLASDPDRIRELCQFVQDLLGKEHDPAYRHPDDIAICAALVILEQSPLSPVRNLFARLSRLTAPSLAWVRRMADHCLQRYVPCDRTVLAGPAMAPPLPVSGLGQDTPGLRWARPEIERERFGLHVA